MALSQKHVGKCLVPWFCSAEWRFVFDKIYGNNNNMNSKREALEILNIWKARTPLLPCGIEGTFIILEGLLLDYELYESYNLRLLLSTSVMRFLNICTAYSKSQGTFYQTARRMKLPEWLINLRHDTAHSQNLPSLDILERALTFCLDWLYREYWKPFSSDSKDFVDSTEVQIVGFDVLKTKLEPMLSNYCYLNLTRHPYWNYTCVKNIADKDAKQAVLDDLHGEINKNTRVKRVVQILWQNIEETLKELRDVKQRGYLLTDLLLAEDVFLGSVDERASIFDESGAKVLPQKFVNLWVPMLSNIHRSGYMTALLDKLLQFLILDHETAERKLVAALWLAEIGKGLSKCILAQDILKELRQENNIKLPQKQLENMLLELCEVKHPQTKEMINLSLLSEIPDILTNCSKFKTSVLDNPNEYTNLFISELLNINEVLKLNQNKTQIIELLSLYVPDENTDISPKKIHTVEDVINTTMEIDQPNVNQDASTQNGGDNIADSAPNIDDFELKRRWRKVTDVDFSKYPIGILPWQSADTNPMILSMN